MNSTPISARPAALLKNLLLILAFAGMGTFYSCKPESEVFDPNPSNALAFSADTFFFDTVFTTQKTVTLRLRVYNPNDKAINIKSVYVNGVEGTYPFTFHVNGRFGPTKVNDVRLEGKDSAYVLMSAKFDPKNQDFPFIITDDLVFEVEGRSEKQLINIRAYGQDAYYYQNTSLACNTVWKKDRPIIIMDTVSVPPGCTLTVESGTRVYGYNAAFLIVRGTLLSKGGKMGDSVTFQGTRRESYYQDVPGQWGGILIMDGSTGNRISYTTVKNSYRGIQVGEVGPLATGLDNAELIIDHSYIQNIVDYGILGLKSAILAVSNQIADCGQSAFYGAQGGVYELWHNTVGQSGNNNFQRDVPQVVFSQYFDDGNTGTRYLANLFVKSVNNIISGSETEEIGFTESNAKARFDTLFYYNILKSTQSPYFKNGISNKGNMKIQTNYRFKNSFQYNFRPDSSTFAQPYNAGIPLDTVTSNFGDSFLKTLLKEDIAGNPRPVSPGVKPDDGAYQRP